MLTTSEVSKACRLNPIWRQKLGPDWPSSQEFINAGITEPDPADPDFAIQMDAYQDRNSLTSDGIVGPKTALKIRTGEVWVRPVGQDSFIVNGARIPVDGVEILDWTETKLTFGGGHGMVSKRTERVVMGHLHTTGGEGSYHQVWNTLVSRELSVDALLDDDVFCQYTDPARVATWHGGWANAISWGWEITNDIDPTRGSRERPDIQGTLLGQPHTWDGLLPWQAEALPVLVKAWCDAFQIPYLIPGRNGKVLDGPCVDRKAVFEYRRLKRPGTPAANYAAKKFADPLVAEMKAAYIGTVVGHFMTSLSGKPDPSPDCFEILLKNGFNVKEV